MDYEKEKWTREEVDLYNEVIARRGGLFGAQRECRETKRDFTSKCTTKNGDQFQSRIFATKARESSSNEDAEGEVRNTRRKAPQDPKFDSLFAKRRKAQATAQQAPNRPEEVEHPLGTEDRENLRRAEAEAPPTNLFCKSLGRTYQGRTWTPKDKPRRRL